MPKGPLPNLSSSRGSDALRKTDGGPLLRWYRENRRVLPWRRTNDPYAIWVSEAMLQRTQVTTVIPYWERWMARFPTVEALASAGEQEALAMWQGLGYYRRCRLLLAGARWVVEHGLPTTAAVWREVPGVGPYTAAAIASIAQGDPAPLVDGNVERVYARLTGDPSSGPTLHRAAWKWAAAELFQPRPGDWNQALMELGAVVCRPVEPICSQCPLESRCVARHSWRVSELPTRLAPRATIQLYRQTWFPMHEEAVGVRQIPEGQWWQGMWEFPTAESEADLRDVCGAGWLESLGRFRHSVTHHRIMVEASILRCETRSSALRWVAPAELADVPMPSPHRKILRMALPLS